MNLPCKIIEDMLPMYHDKVCSEESARLIEAHLQDCPHCSNILSELRSDLELPEQPVDDMKPLKKIQKAYKKMRRHWWIAIVAILFLIPIAFFVGDRHGGKRGESPVFSEEEALVCANSFMVALADGDYAKAFSYWDVESKRREWLRGDDFSEEDLVNLETDGLNKFCQLGEDKIDSLGGITAFELVTVSDIVGSNRRGSGVYTIHYNVELDGKTESLILSLSENGIYRMCDETGLIANPLSQLGLWGHWLYDDYLGRYYDYELKTYIYY